MFLSLVKFFQSKKNKSSRYKLLRFQKFGVWKDACDKTLAKQFPPQSSNFSDEDIESDRRISISKLLNWEIVCQEVLDTQFSHIYFQNCYAELIKRGKSEQDIFEMRKLAWYTAGWLNFAMAMWDWCKLDESDILMAIKWLYEYKQISHEKRIEFEDFVKLHAS